MLRHTLEMHELPPSQRRRTGCSFWLIAGLIATCISVAAAPAKAIDFFTPTLLDGQRVEVDVSLGASTLATRYASLDVIFAPFGKIDETGFRLGLGTSGTAYNFVASQDPWTLGSGRDFDNIASAGYQYVSPRLTVFTMLGVLVSSSEDQGVSRTKAGVYGTLSVSALPSEDTIAGLSGRFSNVSNTYQAQARMGLRYSGSIFLGPEVAIGGTTPFVQGMPISQEQFGVFISGVSVKTAWLGFSSGVVNQNQLGLGAYFNLSLSLAF